MAKYIFFGLDSFNTPCEYRVMDTDNPIVKDAEFENQHPLVACFKTEGLGDAYNNKSKIADNDLILFKLDVFRGVYSPIDNDPKLLDFFVEKPREAVNIDISKEEFVEVNQDLEITQCEYNTSSVHIERILVKEHLVKPKMIKLLDLEDGAFPLIVDGDIIVKQDGVLKRRTGLKKVKLNTEPDALPYKEWEPPKNGEELFPACEAALGDGEVQTPCVSMDWRLLDIFKRMYENDAKGAFTAENLKISEDLVVLIQKFNEIEDCFYAELRSYANIIIPALTEIETRLENITETGEAADIQKKSLEFLKKAKEGIKNRVNNAALKPLKDSYEDLKVTLDNMQTELIFCGYEMGGKYVEALKVLNKFKADFISLL